MPKRWRTGETASCPLSLAFVTGRRMSYSLCPYSVLASGAIWTKACCQPKRSRQQHTATLFTSCRYTYYSSRQQHTATLFTSCRYTLRRKIQ
eukprot:g60015.t1